MQRARCTSTAEVVATKRIGGYRHLTLTAPGRARAVPRRQLRRGHRRRPRRPARPVGAPGPRLQRLRPHPRRRRRGARERHRVARRPAGRRADRAHRAARAGRSRCPRRPCRACSSARATPRRRSSRWPSGCASAAARSRSSSPRPTRRTCSSALEARRSARSVTVLTADGSVGQRGTRRRPRRRPVRRSEADVVYAAGPTAVLRAAAAAAERAGAWSQVARRGARRRAAPACATAARCRWWGRTASTASSAPAPRARSSAATASLGRACERARCPGPVMVAAGCGGTGRELAAYAGLDGLDGLRHPLDHPRRPGRRARPAGRGGPRRAGQRGRPAQPRARALPRHRAAVAGARRASASSSRSPARRWGSTPTWPAASAARRASRGSRSTSVRPTRSGVGLFEVREPYHSASVIAAVRREFPADRPVLAKLRPDVSRIVEGARSCHEAGATAVVDRQRRPGRLPRRALRRAERPGDRARSRCAASPRCTARCPTLPVIGCGGVHDLRSANAYLDAGATSRPGRHRPAPRPDHRGPAAGRPRQPPTRPGGRDDRRSAPGWPARSRSAAASASASTRTPRCCSEWGLGRRRRRRSSGSP